MYPPAITYFQDSAKEKKDTRKRQFSLTTKEIVLLVIGAFVGALATRTVDWFFNTVLK